MTKTAILSVVISLLVTIFAAAAIGGEDSCRQQVAECMAFCGGDPYCNSNCAANYKLCINGYSCRYQMETCMALCNGDPQCIGGCAASYRCK